MSSILYLPWWFFKARILGIKRPLQTVLFISDRCNLACKHCSVYRKTHPNVKSYEQIKDELEYSYRLGSRFVDFEGGEPTIWRDGDNDLNSLIRLAKSIGFFSTTITTNGYLPFDGSEADSIWVSVDGTKQYHDEIRGEGSFDRLVQHIEQARHPHLSVNMVVNNHNYTSVEDAIRFAAQHPNIRLISLNFYTPYPGAEHLFIPLEQRRPIIDRIIAMKKAGYPIMNSVSGLKLMKNLDFKKECWICNFIMPDGVRLPECAGKTAGVCDSCGFCMSGEMRSVFTLRPDTLLAGMKLRM